MKISLRRSELARSQVGYTVWLEKLIELDIEPSLCAILVCDVWDGHWCRGARERLAGLVPRMDEVLRSTRNQGMSIVHAPSDTMDYYDGFESRRRILELPLAEPPAELQLADPPLPIQDSDHGSDTGETEPKKEWHRQHAGLYVDESRDVISDDGREIYSWLQHRRIEWLFIMGVHTNMCVLHRSFGIKQMVRWGVQTGLVRDLTDSMYNPASSPYVSHEEGTDLVVGFIEKQWCPTLHSRDLAGP